MTLEIIGVSCVQPEVTTTLPVRPPALPVNLASTHLNLGLNCVCPAPEMLMIRTLIVVSKISFYPLRYQSHLSLKTLEFPHFQVSYIPKFKFRQFKYF